MKKLLAGCVGVLFLSFAFARGQGIDREWLYFVTNFNAVVFGDFTATGGDTEYRLAVGGTTTFTMGYSVGMPVTGLPLPTYTDATTDILIAGGDLYDGAFGVNGNIVYSGTRYGPKRYMTKGNVVEQVTPVTFDASGNVSRVGIGYTWEQLLARARSVSASMGALENQGVTVMNFSSPGKRFLTGTNEHLNVFNVTASNWNMSSSQIVISAPASSVVLVNIHGDPVSITNSSIKLIGVNQNHVIYNFVDATQITTKSFLHRGSVLAPYASAALSGGAVNGTAVFGGNVTTMIGFEFHNFPYSGGCSEAVNNAPFATPQAVTLAEDALAVITLSGTDPEGEALTFRIVTAPTHGTLSGVAPNLTYTPVADYNGSDTFTFTATDASGATSPPAAVTITVTAVNDAPTAMPQAVTLAENASVAITLSGTDPEGEVLTFQIVTPPAYGTLSGVAPVLTYTPVADYNGSDTFTFTATDASGATSLPASVTIAVTPVNNPPVVTAGPHQEVALFTTCRLLGVAQDDGLPESATLTLLWAQIAGPVATVIDDVTQLQPMVSFSEAGMYRFQLTASDGALSATAETSVFVMGANPLLLVDAGPDLILPWTNRTVYLKALISAHNLPADGQITTDWSVVEDPRSANFYNWDETTMTPQDGQSIACEAWATFSEPGEYVIRITACSDSTQAVDEVVVTFIPPDDILFIALCQSIVVYEDTPLTFAVMGYAARDHQLGFLLANPPLHGTLDFVNELRPVENHWSPYATRDSAEVCYTPDSGFYGGDSFTFWVFEKAGISEATVWITVLPVTAPMETRTVNLITEQDTPSRVYLGGLENDNQPLSFTVSATAMHGTVSFDPFSSSSSAIVAVYSPDPGYVGKDQFVVEASDATTTLWTETVNVVVQERTFTVTAGADLFLDGLSETTLSGEILISSPRPNMMTTIVWVKRSGPGQVCFSDISSLTPTASFKKSGNYTIELLASYGGIQKSDLINVVVAPTIPEDFPTVRSSAGTDFWLAEMGNFKLDYFRQAYPDLKGGESYLEITSEVDTQGVVSWDVTGLNYDSDSCRWVPDPTNVRRKTTPFSVLAGQRTVIKITVSESFINFHEWGLSLCPLANDAVSRSAIHVTANDPVSVFKTEEDYATTGGYHALPTDMLGTHYWVMSYPNPPAYDVPGGTELVVVAPRDNTHVSIMLTADSGLRRADVPFSITLQSGEVYRLANDVDFAADFTGTEIVADKPIAVFSGNRGTIVPDSIQSADQICEQMPPVEMWGQRFFTLPFATRLYGDTFRFLAASDNTEILTNGVAAVTLSHGGIFECVIDGPCEITADAPVLVAQFANGGEYDTNENADPAMTIVPAVGNYGTAYSFTTPNANDSLWSYHSYGFDNYVNVIVPENALDSFTVDGESVDLTLFQPIFESGYYGAQIAVSAEGAHRLEAVAPFGAVAYGWDPYCAYAYPAGLYGKPLAADRSVSLWQATPYSIIGRDKHVVARVTNDDGSPMPDISVQFTINGANPISGWGRTSQNGEVSFTYSGTQTGSDQICASLESARSTLTNTWLEASSNQPPVISIDPIYHVKTGTWCDFTAGVSDDALPEGGGLSAVWRLDSGFAIPEIRSTGKTSISAFFEFPGVYVLELTACDGELSTRTPVTVVVNDIQLELWLYPNFGDEIYTTGENRNAGYIIAGQDVWLEVVSTPLLIKEANVEFYDGDEKVAEAVLESRWFGRWEAGTFWTVPNTPGLHEISAIMSDQSGNLIRTEVLLVKVPQIKLALHQFTPMAVVGEWKDVYVELIDEDGISLKDAVLPYDSEDILFSLSGTHSESNLVSLDGDGEAYFSYEGTESGIDIIQAEYNGYVACVTNEWVASSENKAPVITMPEYQVAIAGVPFHPQITVTDDGLPGDHLSVFWNLSYTENVYPVISDSRSLETTLFCEPPGWPYDQYDEVGVFQLKVYVHNGLRCSMASTEVSVRNPEKGPNIQYFELVSDQSPLIFYLLINDSHSDVFTVDIFEGDTLLKSDITDAYALLYVDPPRNGNLVFTARVTSESGQSEMSEPVYITLGESPTLAWIKPIAPTVAFVGHQVELSVAVADADGAVTNVTYYRKQGMIKLPIGRGTGSDFSFSWVPPSAGDYTLIAVAMDNDGLSSTNVPHAVKVILPRISGTITAPLDGDTIYAQSPTDIRLGISDPLNTYDHAEVFANGISVGVTRDTALTWVPNQAGDFVITAEITDREGNCCTAENSLAVQVILKQKPSLEWLAPLATDALFIGYPAELSVVATDPDGTVTKVLYYLKEGTDYVLLGQGAGAGFVLSWTPSEVGIYTLVAVATDNTGVDSDWIGHGVVVEEPWVKGTLVAPQNDATVIVDRPQNISLTIDDPAGLFASAEIFVNGVSLGAMQASSVTWIPDQAGDYEITAQTTDINGVFRDADNTITVHVVDKPRPTLTLIKPETGSRLRAGVETRIIARLRDPGALATNLLFFANESCIGTDGTYVDWTPTELGSHTLYCVALTRDGQNATSAVVAVEVALMSPPTVTLLSPTNTQRFAVGTIPSLSAEVADPDGPTPDLTLLLDGKVLAETTTGFLEMSITNATPGWYAACAQATDADGLSASSPIANFFVERAQNSDLPVPNSLSAEAESSSEITLFWQPITTHPSVQGIVIERWNALQSLWDEIAQISCLQTNYLNSGLISETAYRYRIACIDAEGGRSDYSEEAVAVTPVVSRRYSVFDLTTAVESLIKDPVSGNRIITTPELTHFDSRRTVPLGAHHAEAVLGSQAIVLKQAVAQFTETWPQIRLDFDPVLLSPQSILPTVGYLTGPGGSGVTVSEATAQLFDPTDPNTPTKAFLQEHQDLFGFGPEALEQADVCRDSTSPLTGTRTCVWQQQVAGVPVFNALFTSNVTADAELAAISCSFIPSPLEAAPADAVHAVRFDWEFPINGQQALLVALQNVGEAADLDEIAAQSTASGVNRLQRFEATRRIKGEAHTDLVWFPANRHELTLAWQTIFTSKWRDEMYLTLVSALDGQILYRRNLTVAGEPATYRVYTGNSPAPSLPGAAVPTTTQPAFDERSLVTLEALDIVASPAGWINDGDNEMRGNNASAHLDRDDNDKPDLPYPVGTPPRTFDFQMPFAAGPVSYGEAAIAQAFFWNNWMHDMLYGLGFTEAAGNFQNENFGYAGREFDAVQVDVQNGLYRTGGRYRNTASISVPPDGYTPRMQLSVFDGPIPNRDSGLDADVILHEYTHGLSIRTVGGGAGIDALQTAGMGEGWSDFYALSLMAPPDADVDASYPIGVYVARNAFGTGFEQNGYFGLRRYPYSTDTNKNPLAFADIDPEQASPYANVPRNPLQGTFRAKDAREVHQQGEVWCAMLWEMRANLIRKYGHEKGNTLALALVTEGMRLSPQNPTYVQARDAILLADRMLSDGIDASEIWAAFVKRGLGYEAEAPYSYTTSGIQASRDDPPILVAERVDVLDGNGLIGGADESTLQITLCNQGTTDTTGVSARLTTTTPGVEVLQANVIYGDISAGQSGVGTATFRLRTNADFVDGSPVELSLAVTSDQVKACGILHLHKGRSADALPPKHNAVLNMVEASSQVAMSGLTPYDIGHIEPLWMADDASCLLKAATGKYVLWSPQSGPVALMDQKFIAHRLTRHGVVVGEKTEPQTTDDYGNILKHSKGVAWFPGEASPRPLTKGPYVYPKEKKVGDYVGLAFNFLKREKNGSPVFLGCVRTYPSLNSVWDLNKDNLSVGSASVYMLPWDKNGNHSVDTNEMLAFAPTQWCWFRSDRSMEWTKPTERDLSAVPTGARAQGVLHNALLISAACFNPDLTWKWLGPLHNDTNATSVVSLATLINDNGDVAGMGVDKSDLIRVFRWSQSCKEFTLSHPFGEPRVKILGPEDVAAFPSAMNQLGDIVGYLKSEGSLQCAAVWEADEETAQKLSASSSGSEEEVSAAYAINESRQIVGAAKKKIDSTSDATAIVGALWQSNAAKNGGTGWELTDLNDRIDDLDWLAGAAVGINSDGWILAHAQHAIRDAEGKVIKSEACAVLLLSGDLGIDSDNNGGVYGDPDRLEEENRIEDDKSLPGKILTVNDGDTDGDGIPGFADGYRLIPEDPNSIDSANDNFTPLMLELPRGIDLSVAQLKFVYSASDPAEVTWTNEETPMFNPPPGELRIWTKDAKIQRSGKSVANTSDPGHFVPSDDEITPDVLGFIQPADDTAPTNTFYVEAIRPSKDIGAGRILVRLDPDGDGPLDWADLDAVRVTALTFALIPDFDRNGEIDEIDRYRTSAKGDFRFWINDDRDSGFWGTKALEDGPEFSHNESSWPFGTMRNALDDTINGVRDLVDFFALRVDLPEKKHDLSTELTYKLKQADGAVNFAYTSLTPESVGKVQKEKCENDFGRNRDMPLESASVYQVTAEGIEIASFWLNGRSEDQKSVVLLCEGRAATKSPLVLEVYFKKSLVASISLNISLSSVKDMFRYLNVRQEDRYFTNNPERPSRAGHWSTNFNEPLNLPDSYLLRDNATQKTIVMIHGLDWDEEETPAGQSEIFKRLYQAGSNARYVGVSWASDLSRRWLGPLVYANDVIGAFIAAKLVTDRLGGFLGQNTTVVAHSLGNILVSSAIQDQGMSVGNYVMLNPAVPVEAYDGRASASDSDRRNMTHPNWRGQSSNGSQDYPERVMAAGWSTLFSGNDPRSSVTWDGRFSGVLNATTAWQFYSSGEEILRPAGPAMPSVLEAEDAANRGIRLFNWISPFNLSEFSSETVAGAQEWVWVYHEMTKGVLPLVLATQIPRHLSAGWTFNIGWDYAERVGYDSLGHPLYSYTHQSANDTKLIADATLVASPFFGPFNTDAYQTLPGWEDIDAWIYRPNGDHEIKARLLFQASDPGMAKLKNHAKLLAEMIPPLSSPAGGMALLKSLNEYHRFNMENLPYKNTALWPNDRPGKSLRQQEDKRWLHGDYKDAPFRLTHTLYEKIKQIAQ